MPPRPRRWRRCATARTSSSRRPSSTVAGAATRTSCSSDRTGRARPSGLELRHRGHQARPVRQGRRDPPDVRLRRPAGGPPGHRARVARTSSPATASATATGRTTSRPTSATSGPDSMRASPTGSTASPPRPTRIPSTTAGSAPGTRRASSVAATTTTSRSWPGCAEWTPSGSWRPTSPRWPRWPILDPTRAGRRHRDRRSSTRRARAGAAPAARTRRPASACSSSSRPTRPTRAAACRPCPEPSPWDLFFDIEADPWATEVGLEYLLGVVEEVDGEPRYHAIWATHAGGGEGRLRAVHPARHRASRRPSGDARLPLRRLRVGRASSA